ncbi:membrane metallo-endopeptidase-like 1 isoform X3 [Pseudomyrmex gracilis]|uniref:membrane metallo-endopeptidase-like 1 isoform X3 n=1 Tax=Pseudomyrmex gracilis TaxID=219809 RepID=UPI0009959B79|nr:membrane metallo-endopeptidase-like 1 isoform X3 [Pseudomyrmex gracilis]
MSRTKGANTNLYFVVHIYHTMKTYHFFIIFLTAVIYAHGTFDFSDTFSIRARFDSTMNRQYMLCATNKCKNAALEILSTFDRSVDPCDNFYKFACGGWLQTNRSNTSFPVINFFTVLKQKLHNQLREILNASFKPTDTMSFIKAKRVFAQCMDKENNKAFGMSNLNAIVNSYGGWPIVMSRHEWNERNLTWQNVTTNLHKNKVLNIGLYDIEVSEDLKMSNSNAIYIFGPALPFSRDKIILINNTKWRKEMYRSTIVNVAHNLITENGGTSNMSKLTQDALDIVHFEAELANLTSTVDRILDTLTSLTIQQLQEKYDKQNPGMIGKIDWHSAIQDLFASERIAIKPSEKLIVVEYEYLINLVPLLERTPSRTIVNFIIWSLIRKLTDYIKPQKLSGIARVIIGADNNQLEEDDKNWMPCINSLNLDHAISHEYVKKYISLDNIQDITEIYTNIKSVVHQQIGNATWMDEPTKEAAVEKLTSMKHEFFKPDWYSDEAIDRYYEDLNIGTEYLDNIINIWKFKWKKMINSLRTPVDNTKYKLYAIEFVIIWLSRPTQLQAKYNMVFNSIVLTAALLQSPVYDRNHIALMNYGKVGHIIGHEINHAFDVDGRNFDKNGNIMQTWTQKSIDEYENITQCFIKQYNKYLVPGLERENIQVNGQQTLGENTADAAGIVSAYYAYKNRKERLNETEWRLQGLEDYSEDQIFFLVYAQFFCENALPEEIQKITSGVHSVKEIRIRGSLSNSREFSQSYNCSVGTPMNPEKKCALWF